MMHLLLKSSSLRLALIYIVLEMLVTQVINNHRRWVENDFAAPVQRDMTVKCEYHTTGITSSEIFKKIQVRLRFSIP